jgi:hypothetical protein
MPGATCTAMVMVQCEFTLTLALSSRRCAQNRPIQVLHRMLPKMQQTNQLPEFLFIGDDDTWINPAPFLRLVKGFNANDKFFGLAYPYNKWVPRPASHAAAMRHQSWCGVAIDDAIDDAITLTQVHRYPWPRRHGKSNSVHWYSTNGCYGKIHICILIAHIGLLHPVACSKQC